MRQSKASDFEWREVRATSKIDFGWQWVGRLVVIDRRERGVESV